MSYAAPPNQNPQQPPPQAPPGQQNWQPMQNQAPWGTFQQALVSVDPVLDFFVKHPHFVEHLMTQFGQLMKVLIGPIYLALQAMWQAPPLAAVNPKPQLVLPDMVKMVDEMQLDSDAFLALLTEHQQYEIQQMHEQNHDTSVEHGYAHYDQESGQSLSPWGVSGGGQPFQGHQSDPYQPGQPQYPNDPVGFQQSPWQQPQGYPPSQGQGQGQQQPTLTGALFGLGANYLMNPQQQ